MAGQEDTRILVPSFARFFSGRALLLFSAVLVVAGMAPSDALAMEVDIDSTDEGASADSEEDTNEHEHHYAIEYFNGRTRGGKMVTIYQCICGAKQYSYYA